jgi:hypothetical protein
VDTARPQPGDVVYLASEVVAPGRIFEIGARAVVLEVGADGLVIELNGESFACRFEAVVQRQACASRARSWARARPPRPVGPAPMAA